MRLLTADGSLPVRVEEMQCTKPLSSAPRMEHPQGTDRAVGQVAHFGGLTGKVTVELATPSQGNATCLAVDMERWETLRSLGLLLDANDRNWPIALCRIAKNHTW
jgi:hypothetical protein